MKVAIAGYGLEGEASYKYWKKLGADITIFDEKLPKRDLPDSVETIIGAGVFEKIEGYNLVVRTASLEPKKINTTAKRWSATNEFFTQCPAPIIGVTGTKGKGTTTSLIAEILKAAGKKVHVVGNIGIPALLELPNISDQDIVVYELSSFQLWDLEKSPHIAVVLMIESDHMDIHASMEEYIAAKSNIVLHQSAEDVVIYHPNNVFSVAVANQSPAHKIRFMTDDGAQIVTPDQSEIIKQALVSSDSRNDTSEWVSIHNQLICKTSEVGLLGAHNLENICAAITATWAYTTDIVAIKKAITTFTGLPHRLEFVRELGGVTFIDDSFSSAPGAAIAAVRSFTQPVVAIVGGFDRDLDLGDFAKKIVAQQNIKKLLLIGQTKQRLAQILDTHNFSNYEIIESTNFTKIINIAATNASEGDIVLLSPGSPSFDMFKNFSERGDQFKKIVGGLL